MTKITVFGQEERKAIEFVWFMSTRGTTAPAFKPFDYDNICLIGHESDYDQIMAWDDDENCKYIYLGHWNDGVV